MENLLLGFANAFQPYNLFLMVIGMIAGISMGAIPGLGGTVGCALLIPFTFTMEPVQGILIMVVLYMTSVYGGSITSILFNIPGEAPSIATTFDGYPLTKKGKASLALAIAMYSSFFGGVFSVTALVIIAPSLSNFALRFGDAEYFAMVVMGLSICSGIGGGSVKKNALSAMLGLFMATWGVDEATGYSRFTFGSTGLLMGISFVPAALGLFAISEVFEKVSSESKEKEEKIYITKDQMKITLPPWKEFWRMRWLMLRSASLGTFLGILPGVGATLAAFFGYSESVRWSKTPEKFGTGIVDGVAAPETANNAAVGGAMVPLLTMGIPGSANTAVMIGAFVIHGIRPGPLMMVQQPLMVNTIFAGLFFSNILLIIGGVLGVRYLVKILNLSYSKIGTGVILLAVTGSYSLRGSMVDVWVTAVFGVLGFLMKRYGYGLAPMVLGLILGPLCETSFQRAIVIADYSYANLVTRPITGVLLAISVFSLLFPTIKRLAKKIWETQSQEA